MCLPIHGQKNIDRQALVGLAELVKSAFFQEDMPPSCRAGRIEHFTAPQLFHFTVLYMSLT